MIIRIACLFALFVLASSTVLPPQRMPFTPRTNKLGVHLLLTDGLNDWPIDLWASHLDYARRAVGEWGFVIVLVRLDDLDVERWQHFMDLCSELHLTPMLRLATTLDPSVGWTAPPRDHDGTYRRVAARYAKLVTSLTWPPVEQTGGHYLIVGNEPNHGGEWGGGKPDPAAYGHFLLDVADTMHLVDPHVQILNAGLDLYAPHSGEGAINGQYFMDAETFLDEMVAAHPHVLRRVDIWSSHNYPQGPFRAAPWEQGYQFDRVNGAVNPNPLEVLPNIYNRGINGYEWELFKLASYGITSIPVIITETGWRHAESESPNAHDGGQPWPDAETVAIYTDLALHGNNGRYPTMPEQGWMPWIHDPRLSGVVFFAFDGHPDYWGHTNWLRLHNDGQIIGTYAPFEVIQE